MSMNVITLSALFALAFVTVLLVLLLLFKQWQRHVNLKIDVLTKSVGSQQVFSEEIHQHFTVQQTNIQAFERKVAQLTSNQDKLARQVSAQIKSIQGELLQLQQSVEQEQQAQPEDKLYSRAYKLAALGAGLDEIMTECELPRAEAEMLLSVYNKKIR